MKMKNTPQSNTQRETNRDRHPSNIEAPSKAPSINPIKTSRYKQYQSRTVATLYQTKPKRRRKHKPK